ncbi:MAG TPA: triose-phosphate isomerase [Candidatus Paceibacterota bacterium]|nr:triose-phosphate isomerase [Candidatus Paceibacterota bacterium]
MLIVSNWKAYVEKLDKAKELVATANRVARKGGHELVLAPPAPFLAFLASGKTRAKFAAQNLSLVTAGAHTGEVTAAAVVGAGASYAIVGHSERRAAGETDAEVLEKVRHALAHKLTPIVCVGERERDADARYLSFVREQLAAVFSPLTPKERLAVVVAYEPVWAIGKGAGDAITTLDLAEMIAYIRKVLGDYIPGRGPQKVRILYGGSVEPANIRDLAGGGGIDGFLIGHASADVPTYAALLKALS